MTRKFVWTFAVVIAAAILFDRAPINAIGVLTGTTGVALTPRHFPKHGDSDIKDMFVRAKPLGRFVVTISQWGDPSFPNVPKVLVNMSKDAGLTTVLGLSPTTLTDMRGKLDVPASVRRSAGRNLSFGNKAVEQSFVEAAVEVAKLKPDYLCLATEINMLAFRSIQEYVLFARAYKMAYKEAKKISPSTKIFVSFQWDFFPIMAQREPDRIKEHAKLVEIFRPELDGVGFTSYPNDHFKTPADIPANYYDAIFNHVKPSEEIYFMEIAWPATNATGETAQVQFINRLPQLLGRVKPKMLAWGLLHDVDAKALPGSLPKTGLLWNDGKPKPGYDAFRALGLP